MKKLFFLIMTIMMVHVMIYAQWSTNPAINNVICNLAGEQAIPKVACCTNGDTYIAYFSNETGNYDVRLQRLDVSGNLLWVTNGILVSNNPSMSWLTDWDIAADPSGACILAIMDIRNGNNNIYGYRIESNGTFAWGPNGVTLSNNNSFNAAPKVISTLSGNAVFAWQADSAILMQKIGPTGTFLWGTSGKTWMPSGASSTHGYSWPQLMPVGSDDFLMKYFEDSGSGMYPTRYIWVQKFNSNGTGVWATPASVSNAGGIASFTQILSFINDNNDGCFVAWHDDRDNDMKSNSWVQHVSPTGTVTLGTNGTEVSGNYSNNHFYPQAVIPASSTDVYVFWNEMNSLQSQKGITGQKVSSTGSLLWGPNGMSFIPVSPTDVYPLMARSYSTDMVVFYEEYVGSVDQLLKAMRITPTGTFAWTGNSVLISSVVSAKVHTEVSNLNNNQWILTWEDDRNADADIYAQNLKPTGDLGPVGPLTYGNIDGTVTLIGGTGSVTSVVVSAGSYTTHPDATGHYTLSNVLTGTYTVNASLSGYTTGSVPNVVVLNGQTTYNVNMSLTYVPVTGFITGTVTLNGGTGSVTQVLVSAGLNTAHPDINGVYNLEAPGGTYNVSAALAGYATGTVSGVVVVNGQTTSNVNFTLNAIGSILGHVALNGGSGVVTNTIISAGTYSTHPDPSGNYGMDVYEGTYTVTASLSGYEPGTVNNVVVVGGQATTGVNFTLNPVVSAGTIEGTVTLEGGSGIITQAVVNAGGYMANPDISGHYSLIVEAGTYDVTASLTNYYADTVYDVAVTVGQTTSGIDFLLSPILGIPSYYESGSVRIIPNPTDNDGIARIFITWPGRYTIEIYDPSGRDLLTMQKFFDPGTYDFPVSSLSLTTPGLYYLRVSGAGRESDCRFIFLGR